MSAPLETPEHQAQKAPRRSGRKPRPSEVDSSLLPPVPAAAAPLRNPSPATGHAAKNNNNNPNKGQPRKISNATDKAQAEVKHVHDHFVRGKATPPPMKAAAYAGSTFQQSPAASALPLPSFYSKSLPSATAIPLRQSIPEAVSPERPTTAADDSPSKPEATPCDFLFNAARQARASPRPESPAVRSGHLSVPNGSPASRSPAPREGDAMFPFELDGANIGEDVSAFATPYKARMEALRSTSAGGKSMNDAERKAKTEALKKLLMKSSSQENNNHNASPVVDMNNPFNARAPYSRTPFAQHGADQTQFTSNHSTAYEHENPSNYTPSNFTPLGYPFPTPQTQTPRRPTSSRLRHVYGAQSEPDYPELSSDSAITPPSSSRKNAEHQPPPQYNTAPYTNHPQIPTHRAKPSAQQLEDDLRRVLKLDLVSRG